MTTEFSQLNLHPDILQAVNDCGYLETMPIQTEIIPLMIAGHDVIGQAQTGTGKTAAFALPILQNLEPHGSHVQSLILAPTRELALQVSEAIIQYGQHQRVRVLAVYGGASYTTQIGQLRRGVDIVVGTPGRMLDLINKKVLDLSQVRTVVLDEADEMLSMGFIEDIQTILEQTPETRQTALFSATLPAQIRHLADRFMHDPQSVTIQREQITVEAIEQRYYMVNQADKTAALTRLFEMEEITSSLIFVRTRVASSELASELSNRGFQAEVLNGDLNQDARERTLNRFRQGKINVLVATDVAARGLDIDNISHVFNFDLPDDPEIYVHRIGRTGRAGKSGIAITLVSPFERRHLREIEAFTKKKIPTATLPTEQDILDRRENQLIEQVKVWLQRGRCRREREIVEQLQQAGFDPLDLAATALKMARADEKQRPIAPLSPIPEPKKYEPAAREYGNGRRERFQKFSSVSHESGMVRLSLNMGKKDGISPSDIVGAIASHAKIPGSIIGKILIQDKKSLVDVPEEYAARVLKKNKEIYIRKQPIDFQRA